MSEFVRIHPQAMTPHQKKPDGWRLVLRKEEHENAELVEEMVLPERVMRPDAQVVLDERDSIMLTTDEATWLQNALGEMLGDCAASRIARACDAIEKRLNALTTLYSERDSLLSVLAILRGKEQT